MIIEFESIPVHFCANIEGYQYCAETGYQSQIFGTLEEAIAAAKAEISALVADYGCLPLFPIWQDYSWIDSEEF